MTETGQGRGRTGPGRCAAVIGAAAAAAAVGVVVAGVVVPGVAGSALASPGARPAAAGISRAGAPGGRLAGGPGGRAGWAAVPYRRAQLSVPGSWLVASPEPFWCEPRSGGTIFVGSAPETPAGCRLTASLAWIRPAGHIPPGITHRRPTAVIHGIPVYRLPGAGSVRYLVPELGVRIGARGPLARRVLATLTRSPLWVVLRSGPAAPVPADWTWHRFGGVRFAAPPWWRLSRASQLAACGTGLTPRRLLLISATRPPVAEPCPLPLPAAAAEQAQPGLAVLTGKYAARQADGTFTDCRLRHGARICLSSVTGQGGFSSGVLIFSAARPHQHPATFFLLGLSGSGTRARAIFDSITVARH